VKRRASALALCLLLTVAGVAAADAPSSAFENPEQPHRLWIQASGYMGKVDQDHVTVIAPRFGGAFLLGEATELHVQLPLVTSRFELKAAQSGETRTSPGNPFFGLSYVVAPHLYRFTLGGGAAVPLARDKQNDMYDGLSYYYARAARGGREGWLYSPNRLPVVVTASLEAHPRALLLVGADMALALMPRVVGRGDTLDSITQVGVWAAAFLAESVRLGGRVDAALIENGQSQLALVPFVHLETQSGTLVRAELVANLDKPYGLAFDDGVWGLGVLAGSRF